MKTLVTNAEIEEVGESLIRRFIGKRSPPPNCIDIEGFITDYLHLPVVYIGIAEKDLDKIGFVSDGAYHLKVWENGEKRDTVYPKGTVVIDRFLLHADKSGQRRFTLAHEAAHVIFERMSPTAAGPCFNRYFDSERSGSFQWPRNGAEAWELSAQQYRWLMEGLSVEQSKAHRQVEGLSMK